MIDENKNKTETHLYCGFRNENQLTQKYTQILEKQINTKKLTSFHLAFSREQNAQYVMDLIQRDAQFFYELLLNEGVIMICGALKMQKDVEETLNIICQKNNKNYQDFKLKGQILTDCY